MTPEERKRMEGVKVVIASEGPAHSAVITEPTSAVVDRLRRRFFPRSRNRERRVRSGFDNTVSRFLQARQVATGARNVNRLLIVGALTRYPIRSPAIHPSALSQYHHLAARTFLDADSNVSYLGESQLSALAPAMTGR